MDESVCSSVRTLLGLLSSEDNQSHIRYFRGHSNKNFSLIPSIYRDKSWYTNEYRIVKEILSRCPTDFYNMSSSFEKLVKMQHYDLPTRLLDLTENPLVALYFACSNEIDKDLDGEILFFKIPKKDIKYFDSDTVSVISNLAWSTNDFEINKSNNFNTKNPHAAKLLHNIRQEKPHFQPLIKPEHIESVVCVKPKMDNPRVVRQDGAFLLFGLNKTKHSPATVEPSWIHYPNGKRYIIKSKDKPEILKQLASLSISKAKLFPEIDMVSQFIKNDFGLEGTIFESTIPKPPKSTTRRRLIA